MTIGDITNGIGNGTNSQTANDMANTQEGYQAFMKLFMEELTHQLPDKPMDTAQMVQVTMAASQTQAAERQAALLGNVTALQQLQLVTQSAQYLGKQVLLQTDKFYVKKSDPNDKNSHQGVDLQYQLPAGVQDATVQIKDSSGKVVYEGPADDTSQGTHTFHWNHCSQPGGAGTKSNGPELDTGDYTITVTAKDKDGKDIDSSKVLTFAAQRVTRIDYSNGSDGSGMGVYVVVGDGIRLKSGQIQSIYYGDGDDNDDNGGGNNINHIDPPGGKVGPGPIVPSSYPGGKVGPGPVMPQQEQSFSQSAFNSLEKSATVPSGKSAAVKAAQYKKRIADIARSNTNAFISSLNQKSNYTNIFGIPQQKD